MRQKKLTWQNLHNYMVENDLDLDDEIVLYNSSTGEEYTCDLVEYNEDGWIPRLVFEECAEEE